MKNFLCLTVAIFSIIKTNAQYDIVIYGGTSAGVIAAYTAA
jgi:ribulose 1,5-bisphosphate synthetase/thiazole synthase